MFHIFWQAFHQFFVKISKTKLNLEKTLQYFVEFEEAKPTMYNKMFFDEYSSPAIHLEIVMQTNGQMDRYTDRRRDR